MSSPGWFDDLPEAMTEAEYRDLPEDISRTIEIVHGHVIKCESPAPRHNRVARRLSVALEAARSPADPCLTVETDIDVVLWRVPRFTVRRPDVVVYQCIDDPASKPSAAETVLVVEVTSPTTAGEDLVDKRAQYATAGIPLYLVVVLDEKYDIWEIREFHLDAAASAYRLHAVHRSVLELERPVRLTLPLADLVSALTPPAPNPPDGRRPTSPDSPRPVSDIISKPGTLARGGAQSSIAQAQAPAYPLGRGAAVSHQVVAAMRWHARGATVGDACDGGASVGWVRGG